MRIIVYLTEQEWQALRNTAERDLRGLREQARYLIVKGLAAELVVETTMPSTSPQTSPVEAEAAYVAV